MKKIICLLAAMSFVFVLGSCSLIGIGSTTTTSATASSNCPDSVAYKIRLSNATYLSSSFNVSNADGEIFLRLNDVYSVSSDGKITRIGKEKQISAVAMEKISR
jgi:hypothetical protein